VRELVLPLYAKGGRHSIDPVVFFKLQLVLFFEDLGSERRLMEVVADRLSLRWYLGYDLGECLPDHSSLTRIRNATAPGCSANSSSGSSRCASRRARKR
jgi:transposase